MRRQRVPQILVEGRHPVVVEPGRDGTEDGKLVQRHPRMLAATGQLAAHIAKGVISPATFELVDRHRTRVVEHVDLLQLRRRAELRGHHVEREVDV